MRVAEIDLQARIQSKLIMSRHLRSLIPSQRTSKLFWQCLHRSGNRVPHCLGSMPGKCRTVLHTILLSVAVESWQMQKHRETRRALNERANR
jgi:hypothetical protein